MKQGPSPSDSGSEHHLDTDHLLHDLKARTVSSGAISAVAQATKFLLTFGSTVVLSRMLSPPDFGLVAMVMTITSFLKVFKDAGLSVATVQREKITHAQVSNLFWINVGLSSATTLVVAAISPLVAWFYGDERLTTITLCLSATYLLTGASVQHMAIMNRQMRFKAIAVVEVGSMAAAAAVGITMASLGFGYWSLVGLQLAMPAVSLILVWIVSKWRPQLPTRGGETGSLLRFGANLTAGSFISSIASGADGLLIGRFCGADQVGLYSRAGALVRRPLEQMLTPISTVFVPVLSRLHREPELYRRIYLQLFQAIALACFVFVSLCLPLSHPITVVVLGEKWADVAVIFSGFILAALFNPLGIICGCLFESQGRGRDYFLANVYISITSVVSFVIGLPYGPAGVAIAYSISCIAVQLPLILYIAGRIGPVTISDLWMAFLKQLPVGIVIGAGTFSVRYYLAAHFQPFSQVALGGLVGLIAGGTFISLYRPSRDAVMGLWQTVRDARAKQPSEAPTDHNGVAADPVHFVPMDKITVVIPTYNRGRLVKRAIESALKQTHPASQIIVVDDGSKDDTEQVCLSFGSAIEYVRQPNAGVSAARNHGIRLARHPWTAFLDSDDYWTPTHLESIAAACAATKGRALLYFTNMVQPAAKGPRTLWERIGFHFSAPHLLKEDGTAWVLSQREPISIQSSVFQTQVLQGSGGFNTLYRVSEDRELFCRLSIGGAICAVNMVGCIQTDDDDPNHRLGGIVHTRSKAYWEHEHRLWSELLARFPALGSPHRNVMKYGLALANWRLARLHWQSGHILSGTGKFLQMARAHPIFIFWLIRYGRSAGWGGQILPPCRA